MDAAHVLVVIVLGVFVVVRNIEGVINERHTRKVRARGGVPVRPDGFYAIAATQALAFIGIVGESFLWPGRGPTVWWGTYPLLALAAAAVALRHWCIATLGYRWTFRVWILPAEPLVVKGPYRFLHHPNYLAVFLEYVTVPLALGLWYTAAVVVPLGAAALLYRKRIEENALRPLRTAAS